jgi:hypothetical protein
VGARLDAKPELLFLLRHVDHAELVSQSGAVEALTTGRGTDAVAVLDSTEVADVFGIEMAEAPVIPKASSRKDLKARPKPKAGKKAGTRAKPTPRKTKIK